MLKNYSNRLIKTINLFDAKLNKNFEHLKINVIKSLKNCLLYTSTLPTTPYV